MDTSTFQLNFYTIYNTFGRGMMSGIILGTGSLLLNTGFSEEFLQIFDSFDFFDFFDFFTFFDFLAHFLHKNNYNKYFFINKW